MNGSDFRGRIDVEDPDRWRSVCLVILGFGLAWLASRS